MTKRIWATAVGHVPETIVSIGKFRACQILSPVDSSWTSSNEAVLIETSPTPSAPVGAVPPARAAHAAFRSMKPTARSKRRKGQYRSRARPKPMAIGATAFGQSRLAPWCQWRCQNISRTKVTAATRTRLLRCNWVMAASKGNANAKWAGWRLPAKYAIRLINRKVARSGMGLGFQIKRE